MNRIINANEIIAHVGQSNIFFISGGRLVWDFDNDDLIALELPVASGYRVRITLAANDTYTVQRVMVRSGKTFNKGEMTNVYCEDLSETSWDASCFRNVDFGRELVNA